MCVLVCFILSEQSCFAVQTRLFLLSMLLSFQCHSWACRHDRRLPDAGDRRAANGLRPSDEPSAAQPRFEELIEGYDQMTPAMRLKAKTRYMLTQATKRVRH